MTPTSLSTTHMSMVSVKPAKLIPIPASSSIDNKNIFPILPFLPLLLIVIKFHYSKLTSIRVPFGIHKVYHQV